MMLYMHCISGYPLMQYLIEQFHCPKNPLGSAYLSLPSYRELLATTGLFMVSITLPFPECHTVGSRVSSSLQQQKLRRAVLRGKKLQIY